MSSATQLWRRLTEFVAKRRASFGTHWVQPENRVTRAIEAWTAAQLAQTAVEPVEAAVAVETSHEARPGQAA